MNTLLSTRKSNRTGGYCRLHDPNGRLLAAKPLFGSFQVKRTLKLRTERVKKDVKITKRRKQ